jgi:phosphoglycolate phosphatase-like HAD superfamily hydrolase
VSSSFFEHLEGERAQRFGETLEKFRKETVTDENYEDFNDRLENTLDQVFEIIGNLQDERAELLVEIERVKERYGETYLESLREDGGTRKELDGEVGVPADLIQVERKLDDWQDYRGELERIGRMKMKQSMDQIDAQSVKTQVLEKTDEMLEKRGQMVEERVDRVEEAATADRERFKEEVRNELREQRRMLREEHQKNLSDIMTVVERFLDMLKRFGVDISDLQDQVTASDTDILNDEVDLDTRPRTADDAVDGDEPPVEYRFTGDDESRFAELERLVSELNVTELSQAEIAARTNLSEDRLFDEEEGELARLEEKFGDTFPELRDEA